MHLGVCYLVFNRRPNAAKTYCLRDAKLEAKAQPVEEAYPDLILKFGTIGVPVKSKLQSVL